jgi:hypothetical protein
VAIIRNYKLTKIRRRVMKKILVVLAIIMSLAFLSIVPGCTTTGYNLCDKMQTVDVVKYQNVLQSLQAYYPALQDLVKNIPTIGPLLQVAVPLAVVLVDEALHLLGKAIAENCTDQKALALAQGVLTQLEKLFAQPETKQAMRSHRIAKP